MDRNGISLISIGNLFSHSAEELCSWSFLCFEKLLASKYFKNKRSRGHHNRPSKSWCLTVSKNIVEKPFCVLETFWYRKMLGIREGRVSQFSVQTVLSNSTKKLRRRTLLCFRKIEFRKLLRIRRRYHYSLLIIFCPTESKSFVGEPFRVSGKVGYRKNLRIRWGYHCFLLLVCCPTESKKFVGEHVCVSENFGYRNFFLHNRRGVYHDFLSKSVSHSTEKLRRANLLCFRKNWVSKKLADIKGTSLFSVDIFWFHSAEKIRAETLR